MTLGRKYILDLLDTFLKPCWALTLDVRRSFFWKVSGNSFDAPISHLDEIDQFSFVSILDVVNLVLVAWE